MELTQNVENEYQNGTWTEFLKSYIYSENILIFVNDMIFATL